MKINVAYNTDTLEVIKTVHSRNWIRRHIIRNNYTNFGDLPRYWKFRTEEVPVDYFNK